MERPKGKRPKRRGEGTNKNDSVVRTDRHPDPHACRATDSPMHAPAVPSIHAGRCPPEPVVTTHSRSCLACPLSPPLALDGGVVYRASSAAATSGGMAEGPSGDADAEAEAEDEDEDMRMGMVVVMGPGRLSGRWWWWWKGVGWPP